MHAQESPTSDEAIRSVTKAITFFHSQVATHGGYVYRYSSDLQFRQGEGLAYDERIWVQPPGTPAVGLAFLTAYKTTKDDRFLDAARDAALALVKGQRFSGGWYYSITFDPQERLKVNYRQQPSLGKPRLAKRSESPGGWSVWKQRKNKANVTSLDDNTTQSALMLLMRVDEELKFSNDEIHEAVEYGLESLVNAQYPIGAWSHNYDRFPKQKPDADHYPNTAASFPTAWSRVATRDYSGCYCINDRITLDAIDTMLEAHRVYGEQHFWDAALRGGDFLLSAQMPDPQPAWAQQYDRNMQPVWDRVFEPPAITGLESQDVVECLLRLYRHTGERKYLDAVSKALVYLRRSVLEDGKLARFYELQSNRPIYFTKDYTLTYSRDRMPTHYQFVVNSRLDGITHRYRLLAKEGPKAELPQPTMTELAIEVAQIISQMDERGAWTEPGWVRNEQGNKVVPDDGIIQSQTFIDNVEVLCEFIRASRLGSAP